MSVIPSTDSIQEYIKEDDVIDYGNDIITSTASEVLRAGHGICYQKQSGFP